MRFNSKNQGHCNIQKLNSPYQQAKSKKWYLHLHRFRNTFYKTQFKMDTVSKLGIKWTFLSLMKDV